MKQERYLPCPGCNRHVLVKDSDCPFCGAPVKQRRVPRSSVRDFPTLAVQMHAHGGHELSAQLSVKRATHRGQQCSGIYLAAAV